MDTPRLTPGAVKEIWDLPDGPGTIKPVLQVADLRPITTKSAATAARQSERFRLLLSDGVHSQQAMLSTDHNSLVKDGSLRVGSIVCLQEITCNTIQERRSAYARAPSQNPSLALPCSATKIGSWPIFSSRVACCLRFSRY
jgi:replication factor A1